MGGIWVQLLGSQGARACVILVLRECIIYTPAVSLVLPAFDDTGFLGFPSRQVVYPPASIVPSWVTASRFISGSSEVDIKPTTISSLILFRVFLSFLFSWPPSDILPLNAAYLLLNNNNIYWKAKEAWYTIVSHHYQFWDTHFHPLLSWHRVRLLTYS